MRIARNIGIALVLLVVLVISAALIVIHTGWFEDFAREKIVAAIEDSTGGHAEVGAFQFNASHLQATIDDLVIHGYEPTGTAPFVKMRRVAVKLRLFGISRVIVQQPEVNVMVLADGRSNVPAPKNSTPSKDSPLKPVVDLAIGHFELNQGMLTLEAEKVPLNVQVNNLKAQLDYNLLARTYGGNISFAPIYVMEEHKTPLAVTIGLPVTIGSDRIELHHATLSTPSSVISIDGSMENIREPKITARLNATVAGADLKYATDAAISANLTLRLAADVTASKDVIRVTRFRTTLPVSGNPELSGSASLEGMRKYQVSGDVRGFDIQSVLKLPYTATAAGAISVSGDLQDAKSLTAQAQIAITPGKKGIPVSGKLNANYSAAADDIRIQNSYLILPHSRLDLDGSLSKSLHVLLKTQNPRDLLAPQTVSLNQGSATFDANVTGGLKTPKIAGHLTANRVVVEGRQFDSVAADVVASGSGVAISNGSIERAGSTNGMRARFSGSAGLNDWKLPPQSPVNVDLAIDQADLADLVALAGEKGNQYTGAVTAIARVTGTVGNPLGSVSVEASKGTILGQPFDQAHVEANLRDQLVTIPGAWIQAAAGRVDVNGEFRHPADSFSTGQVHAHVTSNRVVLPRNATGAVQINLDVTGDLKSEFTLTGVNGNVAGQDLKIDGESLGNLDATLRTSGQTTNYTATLALDGSKISLSGNTRLEHDYPTTVDATITNVALTKLLAAANRRDIPAKGTLSGTAHVTGALSDPHGSANLELTHAVVYDEPIERLRIQANYLATGIDVPQLQIVADGAEINLTGHYDRTGTATFNMTANHLDLARIHNVQTRRPGLAGAVQLSAKGTGTIATGQRIGLRDLDVDLVATGIKAQGENFGDLKLTASASAGNKVEFALDSNLADAQIHGRGTADLTDGYPVNAQLSFNNVLYSKIVRLVGMNPATPNRLEAVADGQVTVNGPVLHAEQLRGNIQITRLSVSAKAKPGDTKPLTIANQGPLTATLNQGTIQLQNVHIAGAGADLQAGGRASITGGPMALTLNGKLGLRILQDFDTDIYSSGDVELNASVRGTMAQPLVNGQLVLKDATLSYAGLPNGISKANGTILLSGSTANIQNLTAESGGGKLTLTGFAEYGDLMRFGIQVRATRVRVRVEPGVSVIAGANVQLTGTSRNSLVSGNATVEQVNYNPTTDIASILSKAAPSVQSVAAPSPILENMRLDVRVRTAPGLSVQASIAEGLSATADLRVQGTAAQPGAVGRVTVNDGKLVFLGSSFSVNSGTVAFYNPTQIDPILDVSLETQTQGIQVILRVTGRVDNMKLSYTSNPPLQFTEIVALLATGKAPTTDPTLLANQPTTPQASFQQMGETAALGQAVASPVAGRLQRVFGVSQLKIDPAFQGGSSVPTARLTLQQRITSNVTFTYTSALDDPNGQIIKVEWAFDPKWSAVATRDQNGIFSVNFFYKRQFQ